MLWFKELLNIMLGSCPLRVRVTGESEPRFKNTTGFYMYDSPLAEREAIKAIPVVDVGGFPGVEVTPAREVWEDR